MARIGDGAPEGQGKGLQRGRRSTSLQRIRKEAGLKESSPLPKPKETESKLGKGPGALTDRAVAAAGAEALL